MSLPFTHDQFLDVFAAYNSALWFLVTVLWLLTATAVGWMASGRAGGRWIAGLLAFHWLWSGAMYHLGYFAAINPAARMFGAAFILQAALFTWLGVTRSRLEFRWGSGRGLRNGLAVFFSVYALAYPILIVASGLDWPRMPAFGVPCPTTLLTVGLLLSVQPVPRIVGIIPLVWSVIGGSAALLLNVIPDVALLAAGVMLLVDLVAARARSGVRAGS